MQPNTILKTFIGKCRTLSEQEIKGDTVGIMEQVLQDLEVQACCPDCGFEGDFLLALPEEGFEGPDEVKHLIQENDPDVEESKLKIIEFRCSICKSFAFSLAIHWTD